LLPATGADDFVVADALMLWYSRFAMLFLHVSDLGSHFKDKSIEEFNPILQINHHMTTAYSPWANGTVEKASNGLQKLLRFFLSEWQMESSQWPLLLPLIQSVLNHSPSVVLDPDANKIWDCPILEKKLKEYMQDLRRSLNEIHRQVETSMKSCKATEKRNANKKC
jgi:transposase InsO family protein